MSDGELQPGDCVAGRYVILEEIGRGGFGIVYRAVQEGVNRHVALKTVRRNAHAIQGFDFAEAFRKEALHMSRLRHPNTITLFDYGETDDGSLYLVTEFLEGETLYERLWRVKSVVAEDSINIAKQIAKSLGEAHSIGIIHGDLKPANIFLSEMYGELDWVKVLDFGIAKIIGEVDPAGLGTPEYMSPEQFSGQPLLAASDVYSLGVILYEMLVGKRPFNDKSTQKLAQRHLLEPLPPMPPEVEGSPLGFVVRRATAKEPDRRYEHGLKLFEALDELSRLQAGPTDQNAGQETAPTRNSSPGMLARQPYGAGSDSRRSSISRVLRGAAPVAEPPAMPGPRPSAQIRSHKFADTSDQLPVIGRAKECSWLMTAVKKSHSTGRGRIVILGAAAGVGKTRMGHWLVREAAHAGGTASGGGAYREGSPLQLEGLADALAECLGQRRERTLGHSPNEIEDEARKRLGRGLTGVERAVIGALFSQTLGKTAEDPGAIADFMIELGRRNPLVIHLDNLRWFDKQSLAVLKELASRISKGNAPVFVVCSLRREALPAISSLAEELLELRAMSDSVVTWPLGPLGAQAAMQFCRAAFDAESEQTQARLRGQPSARLLQSVTRRSYGNPLYIRLLLRHLLEEDLVVPDADGIGLRHDVDVSALIPPKIGGLLRLRKAQLTHRLENGKEVDHVMLRCAALGRTVPFELLAQMLQLEAQSGHELAAKAHADLGDHVRDIAREDILRLSESDELGVELSFCQPLMHQILDEDAAELPDAESLHRRAALAKYRFYSAKGQLDGHYHEIGTHYQYAGELTEAIRFLLEAARCRINEGRLAQAAYLLEKCRSIASAHTSLDGTRLRMLIALGYLRLRTGATADFEALQVLAMRLAAHLEERDDVLEIRLQAAMLAHRSAQLQEATEILEDVIDGFRRAWDGSPLPVSSRGQDYVAMLGKLERLHPGVGLGVSLLELSRVARHKSELDEANRLLDESASVFQEISCIWGVGTTLLEMATVLLDNGYAKPAQKFLQQAFFRFKSTEPPLGLLATKTRYAEVLTRTGDLVKAEGKLRRLLTALGASSPGPEIAKCQLALAANLARQGKTDEAHQRFVRSIEIARNVGDRIILLRGFLEYGRFLVADGHPTDGFHALQEGLRLSKKFHVTSAVGALQRLMGDLSHVQGRMDIAMDWYERSQASAESRGDMLGVVEAHASLARLSGDEGSPLHFSAAAVHLKAAREGSEELNFVVDDVMFAEEAMARACVRAGDRGRASSLLGSALNGWKQLAIDVQTERVAELRAGLGS
jgi:eukaryotic-like serine/threonine-protein kinase